ncbi:TetR/AcrR family transcriptional regulator [Antrihabitans cavernicola]|uniref:TetR/AcrR family transcriptional regulator n=1 Tax=Antrihabitans cavernicola TaxID=2495913 RepID=UPI00165A1245|nr:TetR/AcrR family transcriptional regulator [Spelaeibacter cavernicola]
MSSVEKKSRADTTRERVVAAAALEFATKGFHRTNLSDIADRCDITKASLYHYFPSKHDLAIVLITLQRADAKTAVDSVVTHGIPALESAVDISFVIARELTDSPLGRAGLRLTEEIGRDAGIYHEVRMEWESSFTPLLAKAAAEGDVTSDYPASFLARVVSSLFVGLLNSAPGCDADELIRDLQRAWLIILPGIVPPDKIAYFTQFVGRRAEVRAPTAL